MSIPAIILFFPNIVLEYLQQNTHLDDVFRGTDDIRNDKFDKLPQQCRECDVLFACYGECPKNRFIKDKYGNKGLKYLCKDITGSFIMLPLIWIS